MQQESRYSAARSGGFCGVRECAGEKKPRCNEQEPRVSLQGRAVCIIYTRLSTGTVTTCAQEPGRVVPCAFFPRQQRRLFLNCI